MGRQDWEDKIEKKRLRRKDWEDKIEKKRLKKIDNKIVKIMGNEDWLTYKIQICERLREFVLNILKLSEMLPDTTRSRVINYQITKSGTSVYANYRAALRGRSKAEFFSKLSISVEESDETEMWLELLISSGIFDNTFIRELHTESIELLKILSNMRKKAS